LQTLLNKNSTRTFEELTEALNVDKSTIDQPDRLHAIAKSQKKANDFHMNYPNSTIQNCSTICISHITFSQKETVFVSNYNW